MERLVFFMEGPRRSPLPRDAALYQEPHNLRRVNRRYGFFWTA